MALAGSSYPEALLRLSQERVGVCPVGRTAHHRPPQRLNLREAAQDGGLSDERDQPGGSLVGWFDLKDSDDLSAGHERHVGDRSILRTVCMPENGLEQKASAL